MSSGHFYSMEAALIMMILLGQKFALDLDAVIARVLRSFCSPAPENAMPHRGGATHCMFPIFTIYLCDSSISSTTAEMLLSFPRFL